MKSIADALQVSADTLLAQAGLVKADAETISTEAAIRADPKLTDEQKTSLLSVYRSYTAESK
jgi:hypothetical protein